MAEHDSSHFTEPNAPLPEERPASGIVDFAAFEHQKENIQPLRRGRAASTLAMLYGTPTTNGEHSSTEVIRSMGRQSLQPTQSLGLEPQQQRDGDHHGGLSEIKVTGKLQAQNAQFQAEIAAIDPVETEDPLDVYYRYIQWLFEVFPQATGHQAIIKLVETPLTLFRGQERYRNDARYVKMWIWYTGLINDGQEAVFQYLLSNKIGDSLAVLYEEYAKLLESREKIPRADKVFQLGIARKAQPLARLERRHVDFQRRVMMRTMQNVERDQQQQQQQLNQGERGSTGNGESTNRTMLGTKRSSRATRSVAANTLSSAHRGLPDQQQQQHGNTLPQSNSRIAVFSDPDGRHADSVSLSSENEPNSDTAPWRDIGSDEFRRKENMHEATSWRGQKLEQRRLQGNSTPAMPVVKKFTVFCDDTGDAYSAASTQGSPATEPAEILSSALTPRRDRSKAAYTTAESFLRSFTDTDTPSTSRHQPKRGKDKPKQRMGKNPEKMVMPADMLFPHGDDVPQCVEEARAQLSRYAFDYDAWCANERIEAEAIEAECRAAAAAAAAANLESVSLQQNKITVHDNKDDDDDDDDDDEDLDDESASPSFLGKRKAAAISSPTINTRAAREGMLEIWNDVSDSDSESLDGVKPVAKISKISSVADDDYQFTMGPVAPNVIPEGLAEKPAVIPSSARPARFESFLGTNDSSTSTHIAKDENDPPTLMLSSARALKLPDFSSSRSKATPLAVRSQSSSLSGAATVGVIRRREQHFRTNSDDGDAVPLKSKTPAAQRISVFSDRSQSNLHPPSSPLLESNPSPLFITSANAPSASAQLGEKFAVFSDALSGANTATDTGNSHGDNDEHRSSHRAATNRQNGLYYSTPAHGRARMMGSSSLLSSKHDSDAAYPPCTPGYTTNASGYISGSGHELTGISGFTGLSSIGAPTSLVLSGGFDTEAGTDADAGDNHAGADDEQHTEEPVTQTPIRKRLSMAVRDLGNITPKFPKSPADANSHYMGLDDDDEDDEDEDGEDEEPYTENIGEFGDLDSQMLELQVGLNVGQFAQPSSSVDDDDDGHDSIPRAPERTPAPSFKVFRD